MVEGARRVKNREAFSLESLERRDSQETKAGRTWIKGIQGFRGTGTVDIGLLTSNSSRRPIKKGIPDSVGKTYLHNLIL